MNQFESAAVTRNLIEKILQGRTIENPIDIKELYQLCPSAKNLDQVGGITKGLNKKGKVRRIREGLAYKYWWDDNIKAKEATSNYTKLSVPEIRVEERRIIIEIHKCRIVVEI